MEPIIIILIIIGCALGSVSISFYLGWKIGYKKGRESALYWAKPKPFYTGI